MLSLTAGTAKCPVVHLGCRTGGRTEPQQQRFSGVAGGTRTQSRSPSWRRSKRRECRAPPWHPRLFAQPQGRRLAAW
jgi:hypothetical protein